MRIVSYFFIYSVIAGFFSCSTSSSMSGSASKSAYVEDLTVHRIDYESIEDAPPKETVNEIPIEGTINAETAITAQIDEKLEEIAEANKGKRVSGYTVQVYTGNSREAATHSKDMVYRLIPDARPQIQYVQPNYKVKVGRFLDRLEAHKTYTTLRKEFPSAMIIPEKFTIQ